MEEERAMRNVGSSIIVLAGAICFSAGAYIAHDDSQVFVMFVGGIVIVLGLGGWIRSFRDSPQN
jgi:hypothetical protein